MKVYDKDDEKVRYGVTDNTSDCEIYPVQFWNLTQNSLGNIEA